ncbi:sulfite exporter TauE/SafE family protein [Asticcacaulis sp.]|uniref:sulfite exporter TauE/SafE family protein n=1 Tax=Asticcacaulis sp. TaxID=1872648 RepID=UPI002630B9FE|nr:sulfite exporter TauE/SafE family protein [Asticcacaulis sp.]
MTAHEVFSGLFPACGALVEGQGPLWLGLFLAGLTGSIAHCLPMCGPFVLMQIAAPGQSRWARLLLPYHAGRLTTYALLGAAAGSVLFFLPASPVLELVRRALLALVATAFLYLLAEGLLTRFGLRLPFRLGLRLPCRLKAMSGHNSPRVVARYALGLSLGLLPCGLVFVALTAVAAAGNPLSGALGMLAFGAGTVPALSALGLFGAPLLQRWPWFQDALRLTALGVNAVLLFALSARF